MPNFLDFLSRNPRGWGSLPASAYDQNFTTDEYGQPHNTHGDRISSLGPTYFENSSAPSIGDSVLSIAESPARMAVSAVTEPFHALGRLAQNSVLPDGRLGIPDPSDPQNRQDVLSGILSLYGGNAMNPMAAIPKGALASGALREAETAAPLRGYHGTDGELIGGKFDPNLIGKNHPTDKSGVFFDSHPDGALGYTGDNAPNIIPGDLDFKKPMVIDAGADDPASIWYRNRNAYLNRAREGGHDGVIVRSEPYDSGAPQEIYVALEPGTVKSPYTGETLFSDTGKPSLMGSAIAGAEAQPVRAYHGTKSPVDFSSLNATGDMGRSYFGKALYVSSDPEIAGRYAGMPQGAEHGRVFPLDVDGPFASPEEYWKTWKENGYDDAKTQRAILDKGFNGVDSGPGVAGTAIFRPGTVKSATTGETLFSGGVPFGSAIAGSQDENYASGGIVRDNSMNSLPRVQPLDFLLQPSVDTSDGPRLAALHTLPDYGLGPVTNATRAGLPNGFLTSREPDPSLGDRALAAGEFPARATVDQFNRATSGVADAFNDPSLANITNAGVQTGLAVGSPLIAGVAGLGGLGLAAARDLGLGFSSPADAGTDIGSMVKGDPQLELLYRQYQDELAKSTAAVPGRNRTESAAIRAAAGERAAAAMKSITNALAARQAAALAEKNADHQAILDKQKADYDSAVNLATNARDAELGRDRRFSDTDVGKVYDKLGGYAPLVAGFIPGVASRLAYGPAATWGERALRAGSGALFGIGANNVPLAYNAFSTEVDNPEQRAYAAYAYNLPDGHPDKAKAQAMAESLPKLNPLRQGAAKELYDPWKFAERAGMGAGEGIAGHEFGQMLPGAIGGIFRKSSYQLPHGALSSVPEVQTPLVPSADASMLRAGTREAAHRSSGPVGPAVDNSLPALPTAADTAPASARKPKAAGRRSKSAGSTSSAKAEKTPALGSLSAPSEAQTNAATDLKGFLDSRLEPTRPFASGGSVELPRLPKGGDDVHVGPLHSDVAGRTDHLAISVPSGSYVIPSDIVSALGEGNTTAGQKVIDNLFPKANQNYASGGPVVPIMAAGGETVLGPDQVRAIGKGDLDAGHAILDKFVGRIRKNTIDTLKKLPSPAK